VVAVGKVAMLLGEPLGEAAQFYQNASWIGRFQIKSLKLPLWYPGYVFRQATPLATRKTEVNSWHSF
jgi:hypothetical protein